MHQLLITAAFLLIVTGCDNAPPVKEKEPVQEVQDTQPAFSSTIGKIPTPKGYTRINAPTGSFAAWLRQVPLKRDKTVYLYNGKPKGNQYAQYAVIDIPVGDKDLQQCADAVMRLRAEYLFAEKKYNEIAFMDYSGKWYNWKGGTDHTAFEKYLQNVFGWCGSASLEKQLKPVNTFEEIQTGDVLVMGGFPGHAVTVVDMASDAKGEKIFLLAQGYQPAQDMHVLINNNEPSLSPWYRIPEGDEVYTPEWKFYKKNLRRW
jgi:hypothetical protein